MFFFEKRKARPLRFYTPRPFAFTPSGQLYRTPPWPIPGDRARGKRRGFHPEAAARHSLTARVNIDFPEQHYSTNPPLCGFDVGDVSIQHQETTQIVASGRGFIKKAPETSQIPDCSFYLPVSMSRNPAVPSFLNIRPMILRVFGWTLGSFILRLRATRSSEAHLEDMFQSPYQRLVLQLSAASAEISATEILPKNESKGGQCAHNSTAAVAEKGYCCWAKCNGLVHDFCMIY